MVKRLVMVRHGESIWNRENRFTGWTDVDLSERGTAEAREAALLLKEGGYEFDMAVTSVLLRAIRTLWIILDEMGLMWIPVERNWRLNERHYGALQGLNKKETAEKMGAELVHRWRRSYDVAPEPLSSNDPRHPVHDRRYGNVPPEELPSSESLKDTLRRVLPCWHEAIAPRLEAGTRLLIAAHGNSMRALIKYLDGISDDDITGVNIPTGIPLVYEFSDDLTVLNRFYLGDAERVKKAMETAASVQSRHGDNR